MNIKKAVQLSSLLVLMILLGGCSTTVSESVSSPPPSAPSTPVTVTMADGKEITVTEATTYEEIAPYLARTYTAEEIEKLKTEEPYKSYLAQYQDKLLPQGSVVYIPGADSLEMVVSRKHSLTGKYSGMENKMPGAEEEADYFLERYPDGTNDVMNIKVANHQDIGLILHVGMESELEDRFLAGELNREGIGVEIKNQFLDLKDGQAKDISQYEFIKERTGETEVVKKVPEKLLPMGSVVRVGSDKTYPEDIFMITGRMVNIEGVDEQRVYIGYKYPEGLGFTEGVMASFSAMSVEEILYVGMESPEETLCEAYGRMWLEYFMDANGNY